MTLFGQTRPKAKAALLIAALVAVLAAITAAGMLFALFGLGQLSPHMRVERVPYFFWYYRSDPTVRMWLVRGSLLAAVTGTLLVVMVIRQRVALFGEARFAREAELRREDLRADHGILLGRKRGRYLIFGGTEHVLLEAIDAQRQRCRCRHPESP